MYSQRSRVIRLPLSTSQPFRRRLPFSIEDSRRFFEEAEHVAEHHYQVARMTDNEAHEYI
ncbi:hypothetical protein DM826_07835 [Halonotius aquaticus]|uniref:Uncharacterized protein n=1 Tax=Halonotius aquaticus TaxID=2216978 RepID=A0A3A6PN03_9EURY|nr:hypothetical protein DM826_07835 [Halonotius aquaticus]